MSERSRVLFVSSPGRMDLGWTKLPKRKRLAIWENADRNERIARVAEGFATNARRVLNRMGVKASGVRLCATRTKQSVVVLVETSFHGQQLAKQLPRWEVRDAVPVVTDNPLDVNFDPDDIPPPGRIATLMHAVRYGVACDVLVRATGGTGKLDWNSIRGGSHRAGTRPALVIDFIDESGIRERADAEIRQREYREQGFEEVKLIHRG